MTTRRFRANDLDAAIKAVGGDAAVAVRIAERYGMSRDTARKQVARARTEGVGPEICRNVLSVLNVPRSRWEEMLEPSSNGPLPDFNGIQFTALSHGFRVHAEVEPLPGGTEDAVDGHGPVLVGGCRVLVGMGNTTDRPLTVTGVRVALEWKPLARVRTPRRVFACGAGVVPHQLFLELYRERFEGWWVLAEGVRLADRPTRFDPNAGNLLIGSDGGRTMFKVPPGETEWVQAAYLPKDDGLFTISLAAMAVDAGEGKSAKKLSPVKVTRGDWQ